MDTRTCKQIKASDFPEWLETNGLGGYASSTVCGMNTRRYHGLLIAATNPPIGRDVLVSKMDEEAECCGKFYQLSNNQFHGVDYTPGLEHEIHFERDLFPEWKYKIGEVVLKKTVVCIHGKNTTFIRYEHLSGKESIRLIFTPLLAGRNHHALNNAYDKNSIRVTQQDNAFKVRMHEHLPEIHIGCSSAKFSPNPDWYYQFSYEQEKERGFDSSEDLFSPGKIILELKPGAISTIVLSCEQTLENVEDEFLRESQRRENLVADAESPLERSLLLAADQFIVQRNINQKSIIAGYHWFGDWGRDTMISLPGLCLCTGRFEDAKKILTAYAESVSMGMLPNRFPDYGDVPEYNTADATLWFFIAAYKYYKATSDLTFISEIILPVLLDILDNHVTGTRYGIHQDDDGLLWAGEDGVQLTWMDAKVGTNVITPRTGKPVEINALWYNALKITAEILSLLGKNEESSTYMQMAAVTKKSFANNFYSTDGKYLCDVISNEWTDQSFRPNQLFAISLPFPLISKTSAKQIVEEVEKKLVTSRGLRSLSMNHPSYTGKYSGDPAQRDAAYHQGTVWSWLAGAYVDALIYAYGKNGKHKAQLFLDQLTDHLSEGGIGTCSEIFDGDSPHKQNGCIAQAWSIAEWIRVIHEHKLNTISKTRKTTTQKRYEEVA
ncbi:MAG: amylo-alpha-1,6-glucosidase [Bacteroidia bacterium]